MKTEKNKKVKPEIPKEISEIKFGEKVKVFEKAKRHEKEFLQSNHQGRYERLVTETKPRKKKPSKRQLERLEAKKKAIEAQKIKRKTKQNNRFKSLI